MRIRCEPRHPVAPTQTASRRAISLKAGEHERVVAPDVARHPEQDYAEIGNGAVLIDIRPAAQRQAEGEIPGAIVIERNVLEWRLDPRSDHRLPIAGYALRVIVVCSEGYTSSLAAASLLDLGIAGATDLDGGFRAWEAAGLPVS